MGSREREPKRHRDGKEEKGQTEERIVRFDTNTGVIEVTSFVRREEGGVIANQPDRFPIKKKEKKLPEGAIELLMPIIGKLPGLTRSGQAEWMIEFEKESPLKRGENIDEGIARACSELMDAGWTPRQIAGLVVARIEAMAGENPQSYTVISNRELLLKKIREIFTEL